MDAADMKKLNDALGTAIVNIPNYLSNFLKRGAAAGKGWAGWATWVQSQDPAKTVEMKKALVLLSKMIKGGKVVDKDLHKLSKLVNAKAMAKYPTGKDYRELVVYKHLLSLDAWVKSAVSFKKIMNDLGADIVLHPNRAGAQHAAEIVTYDSVADLIKYYIVLQKALDKV
jgi:hypothetical protein